MYGAVGKIQGVFSGIESFAEYRAFSAE